MVQLLPLSIVRSARPGVKFELAPVIDLGVLERDHLQLAMEVLEGADHLVLAIAIHIGRGDHRPDDVVPVVVVIPPVPMVNEVGRVVAFVVQFD